MPRPRSAAAALAALAILAAFAALSACSAPGREQVAEDCRNMIDDDGNGAIDCNDVACMHTSACTPEICDNDLDDDGDGRFDCADSECHDTLACGGSLCGNGVLDPGEDCDTDELAGRTCITQGFAGGTLACASCRIDTTACTVTQLENCVNDLDDDHDGKTDCADEDCGQLPACLCGNGTIDIGEACDGTLIPDGVDCELRGFPGGQIACRADCTDYDTSMCTLPTCGDGAIAPTETCDDGNAVAGDGCDATCQIERDAACAQAKPLPLGMSTGNTADSGFAGFEGSCAGAAAREQLWSFTPATTGTVTIVLNSPVDLALYVRTSCADASSDIACSGAGGGSSSDAVNFAATAGVPVTVFVDASWDPSVAGPYSLIVFESTP
jgi:cysteine-rich repeat protein